MRLWTLHPKYLDPKGLVALWREALLAQAVLRGKTVGYRHHPQLQRFKTHPDPLAAIATYLDAVQKDATARGYRFDRSKISRRRTAVKLAESRGQLAYEWGHLQGKLRTRSPDWLRRWNSIANPEQHPLFRLIPGSVRDWERVESNAAGGIKRKRASTSATTRKPEL
ncbi:MAG: DNA lyase [Burkholderiales bacterium]|nr:DNA lyase [Burkholderiales bacterium]